MTLGKAISIAAQAFADKTDKQGKPYILHCLTVMNKVEHMGEEPMICAVLHDLLEDCKDWTMQRLLEEGFSPRIVSVIDLLTYRGDSYEDYVREIATDPWAVSIKRADLEHNSDISRLRGLTEKDFKRMEKYHKAYKYLGGI